MQALIILSLIVFHLLDQLVGGQVVDGAFWRMCAVPIVMLLGPIVIGLQSIWSSHAAQVLPTNYQRNQQITIGLWFVSGLLLIAVLNWGSILRHQLQLSHFSPLDELILYSPLVISLLLCWAAQFNVERRAHGYEYGVLSRRAAIRLCWRYIAIRASVFLVPATLPLAAVLSSQAIGRWLSHASGSADSEAWVSLALLLAFFAIIPWVMAICWRARRLPEGPLRQSILKSTADQRVSFRDIRIWPTGNQMTNAMVVGLIPKMRMLILTDRLLQLLNADELSAVVAHEAGHVRRHHLLTRMWFIVFPLFVVATLQLLLDNTSTKIPESIVGHGLNAVSIMWLAAPVVYAAYAFIVVGWISRKMEFQADLFACQSIDSAGARVPSATVTRNFCDSLIKLTADSGEDATRAGWLHPSIADRVGFLQRALRCPAVAESFEKSFSRQKLLLTLAIIFFAAIFAMV